MRVWQVVAGCIAYVCVQSEDVLAADEACSFVQLDARRISIPKLDASRHDEGKVPDPVSLSQATSSTAALSSVRSRLLSLADSSMTTEEVLGAPSMVSGMILMVASLIPVFFFLAYCVTLQAPLEQKPAGAPRRPLRPGTADSPLCSHRETIAKGGQVLGIPRGLVPVAQEARVEVRNLANDGVFFNVEVSERSENPGIWIKTPDGAPLAYLDTRHALLDPRGETSARGLAAESGRKVILHRAAAAEQASYMPFMSGPTARADIAEPYAVFVLNTSATGGALVAQRFNARAGLAVGETNRSKFLINVNLDVHGQVTTVKDAKTGQTLASSQPDIPVYSPSHTHRGSADLLTQFRGEHPGATTLALAPKSDTVLILAAVLSVQKLHPYFTV